MRISMRRVDDIDDIDHSFNPTDNMRFRDHLRNKYERTMEYLEKASTGTARQFLDRSRKIFETYNSNEALRKTRNAIRTAKNIRRANRLYFADSLEEQQTAGYAMQRFLMANKTVRKRYHRQLVDGYHETYTDNEPGQVGIDHYDYRRVVDGLWRREKDENGEDIMIREVIYERLLEGDRQPDPEEQLDVAHSWDIQDMFLEAGLDPTNRSKGTLS